MLPEIVDLPLPDRERIVSALHWAIAENEPFTIIDLREFRDGESLKVMSFEYSELYNSFNK